MLEETQPASDVERLVAAALRNHEEGGDPRFDEVCRESPHLLDIVKRRFEILSAMGLVDGQRGNAPPESLGEFRLIKELGGGGMGVVYLAEQEGLGRRVALKLIRPENLYFHFEQARERFLREVKAVARLNHPGIAPIYTFGEENGIPYFAMEYVEGETLELVVRRLNDRSAAALSASDLREVDVEKGPPSIGLESQAEGPRYSGVGGSWTHACFRVAVQVADALAHAHENGVVHRDVKPSNIILTRRGVARLVDFGLAFATGSQRITRSGLTLGSPYYLAPEVIEGGGDVADARTDVYSLGVTLYELLTLRLPFSGESQQSLLMAISSGRATPPRRHNPSIPWDAETVCLKAMDVDPACRYATAEDFARDLRNVIELRPIEAARPGLFLRGRRFAQRRPGLAMAIFAAALIAVGVPIGYGLILQRSNLRLREERDRTKEAQTRAEEHLEVSLRVIDMILHTLSDPGLSDIPGIDTPRREVFESTRDILADLGRLDDDRPQIRHRIVAAAMSAGKLAESYGDIAAAEDGFREGIEVGERLLSDYPDLNKLADVVVEMQSRYADLLRERGEFSRSRELANAALQRCERGVAERPNDLDLGLLYASVLNTSASLSHDVGDVEEEFEQLEEVVRQYRKVSDLGGERPEVRLRVASVLAGSANRAIWLGKLDLARESLAEAEAKNDAVPDELLSAAQQHLKATNCSVISEAWFGLGEYSAAAEGAADAVGRIRKLVNSFPDRVGYRETLGTVLAQLAEDRQYLFGTGEEIRNRLALCGADFEEAIGIFEQIVDADPSRSDVCINLAAVQGSYGDLLQRVSDDDAAVDIYEASLLTYDHVFALGFGSQGIRVNCAMNLNELARIKWRQGNGNAGWDFARRAHEILTDEKSLADRSSWLSEALVINCGLAASRLLDEGQIEEAIEKLGEFDPHRHRVETVGYLATIYSRCVDILTTDPRYKTDAGRELRDECGVRGVEALCVTLELGASLEAHEVDPRLSGLRSLPSWRRIEALE